MAPTVAVVGGRHQRPRRLLLPGPRPAPAQGAAAGGRRPPRGVAAEHPRCRRGRVRAWPEGDPARGGGGSRHLAHGLGARPGRCGPARARGPPGLQEPLPLRGRGPAQTALGPGGPAADGAAVLAGAALERAPGPPGAGGDGAGREHPRVRAPPLRPRGGGHRGGQRVPGGVRRGLPGAERPLLLPAALPGRAAPALGAAGAGAGLRGAPRWWRRGGPAHARSRVGAEPPGAGRALEPMVAAGRDGDAARGAGGVPAGARSGAAVPSAPAQPPPPPRWPLGALAEALPAEAAVLAQELRRIPAVSVAVVNLQYEGAALPVTGFGHLVPSLEDGALLGIVYDSVAFPQHNGAAAASLRLTVMLGGAWFEQSFGDPAAAAPELLLHRAQAAVREQLGLEPAPTRSIVRVHQACIPQYTLGHWQRTEHIGRFLAEHRLPLSLIGASYSGVSVNDCIASAKVAVERLLGPQR
uniref:Amine oxidase domain-containing protein n=1 Tax=Amazona collaria TaxID=241587 RepID=A0A8B9F5P1_9PSIT